MVASKLSDARVVDLKNEDRDLRLAQDYGLVGRYPVLVYEAVPPKNRLFNILEGFQSSSLGVPSVISLRQRGWHHELDYEILI